MKNMEHIINVLGCVTAILILLALITCVIGICSWILEKWHSKGMQAQWHKDMDQLRSNAGWFGECPATRFLIMDLAEGKDVSVARDAWRSRIQSQQKL